jgi:hypothetical protein
MSRFIKIKTLEASDTYPAEFAHINLDAIVEIKEQPDPSRCYVVFHGNYHCRTVYMPAEALIAIIERK